VSVTGELSPVDPICVGNVEIAPHVAAAALYADDPRSNTPLAVFTPDPPVSVLAVKLTGIDAVFTQLMLPLPFAVTDPPLGGVTSSANMIVALSALVALSVAVTVWFAGLPGLALQV